jgi:hypothetical protein
MIVRFSQHFDEIISTIKPGCANISNTHIYMCLIGQSVNLLLTCHGNLRLDRNWEIPEVEKPTFVRRTRRRRRDRKGRPRVRPDPGDNPASRDRKGRRISTPCRERSTPWRKRGCKRTQDIRSCWRCEPAPTGATRFLARCRCRN